MPQDSPDPDIDRTLIGAMYELAINPLAFDTLLSLSDEVDWTQKTSTERQSGSLNDLMTHAERASSILERMDQSENVHAPQTIVSAIQGEPYPVLVLSKTAGILSFNPAFKEAFGKGTPAQIETLLEEATHAREWSDMKEALLRPSVADERVLAVLRVKFPDSATHCLFLLHRAACPADSRVGGLLCALHPVWNTELMRPLTDHFGLTKTEIDILRLLTSGESALDISRARQTSLQTVRTQIKSLLAKTGFGSQIELIRQFGSTRSLPRISGVNIAGAHSRAPASGHHDCEMRSLHLKCGNVLDYALIGPPNGEPVFYIHGLIDSLMMPSRLHQLLAERNVRLIAPVRPYFGSTRCQPGQETPCVAFADRSAALLEHLGTDHAIPVIGHMAGALYAYHFAIRHPERVSHIVAVAGAIPMSDPWQFESMSRGHRIAGLAARHAPALLGLLTRGGIQLLKNQRHSDMLRLAFHDAEIDYSAAQSDDLQAIMMDRFRFVTAQGHRAFETDIRLVSADWTPVMQDFNHPVGLVHGQHDQVVLLDGVQKFADRTGARLMVCNASGQLVWSTNPQLALDMLDTLRTHSGSGKANHP